MAWRVLWPLDAANLTTFFNWTLSDICLILLDNSSREIGFT